MEYSSLIIGFVLGLLIGLILFVVVVVHHQRKIDSIEQNILKILEKEKDNAGIEEED